MTDLELNETIQRAADILQKEIESGNMEAWRKVEENNINEKVARKLGWKTPKEVSSRPLVIYNKLWEDPEGTPRAKNEMPDYCHSIEAAWEVFEKIAEKNNIIINVWERKVGSRTMDKYEVVVRTEPYNSIAIGADTAPMAICLAFLKLDLSPERGKSGSQPKGDCLEQAES